MNILGIDPGPMQSAICGISGRNYIESFGKYDNRELLAMIREESPLVVASTLVIEQIASYGMAVGKEVFETVYWSGRFAEAFETRVCGNVERLPRMAVKMHWCHSSRATDSNIRQAVIDSYGGKAAGIGKKDSRGPLYGIKEDVWQALALALAFDSQLTLV